MPAKPDILSLDNDLMFFLFIPPSGYISLNLLLQIFLFLIELFFNIIFFNCNIPIGKSSLWLVVVNIGEINIFVKFLLFFNLKKDDKLWQLQL